LTGTEDRGDTDEVIAFLVAKGELLSLDDLDRKLEQVVRRSFGIAKEVEQFRRHLGFRPIRLKL